jgi:hypothetical protein
MRSPVAYYSRDLPSCSGFVPILPFVWMRFLGSARLAMHALVQEAMRHVCGARWHAFGVAGISASSGSLERGVVDQRARDMLDSYESSEFRGHSTHFGAPGRQYETLQRSCFDSVLCPRNPSHPSNLRFLSQRTPSIRECPRRSARRARPRRKPRRRVMSSLMSPSTAGRPRTRRERGAGSG